MITKKQLTAIERFRIIDDIFFEMMAKDKGVCEELLQVILGDERLVVLEVSVQHSLKNIYGRSVRLDALCILGDGTRCNIEVQKTDDDDHLKRVRYHAACITTSGTKTGTDFKDIPNVCVVYISQFDIFKEGKTIYHLDNVIRETGTVVDDGQQEIFVNTEIVDGSDIAELMQCFLQKQVENMKFPRISNRFKELKKTEGGRVTMCEVMEWYMADELREEKEKAIRALIKVGATREQIIEQGYSVEEYERVLQIIDAAQ